MPEPFETRAERQVRLLREQQERVRLRARRLARDRADNAALQARAARVVPNRIPEGGGGMNQDMQGILGRWAQAQPMWEPRVDWFGNPNGAAGQQVPTIRPNNPPQTPVAREIPPEPPPVVPVVAETRPAEKPKVEQDEMPEKLANTFLIGCDPEFVVMDKADTVINALNVGIGQRGEVGYDHSGLVLEIRPKACKGSYSMLKRIKNIIDTNDQLKKVSDKKWRAGALVKTKLANDPRFTAPGTDNERILTLGGHVHIDVPPVGYGGVDADLHDLRLSAMDRVTRYLEGLDILPKDESGARRIEGAKKPERYGRWGDWRTAGETDTGRIRVEYRTPASWLHSQAAAYLTLTGIKLAMVSPQLAIDTLKARNISYDNLKAFFEAYRHKDTNARRALEILLEKPIEKLQGDPGADIRKVWSSLEI